MKKITLLCLMVLISAVGTAQVVLEDFSSVGVNIGGGAIGDFGGFGGVTPSLTTDGGDDVGQTINDAAAEPWQGAYVVVDTNFMDLTSNKNVTVDVFNNDGNTFYLLGQVELGQSGNANSQALASHPGNGWQTITFDFSAPANGNAVPTGEYGQFTIYTSVNSAGGFIGDSADPGNNAVDITILIDDITAVAGASVIPPAAVDFPIDFESMTTTDITGFNGAEGSTVEAVAAPQSTGNTSAQLMKIVRNGGEVWAGVSIDVDSNVDFSTERYITYEVWTNAPTGTPMNIKTEEQANAANTTGDVTGVTTGVQNGWETLTYDLNAFAALTNQNRFVMLPNQGTVGDGSIEYYIDNIQNVNTLSNDDFSLENKISVFPNPSNDGVWNILASVAITNVSVYDMLGKKVMSVAPNSSSVRLDASALPAGLYLARMTSESGTKSVKLIKQ